MLSFINVHAYHRSKLPVSTFYFSLVAAVIETLSLCRTETSAKGKKAHIQCDCYVVIAFGHFI